MLVTFPKRQLKKPKRLVRCQWVLPWPLTWNILKPSLGIWPPKNIPKSLFLGLFGISGVRRSLQTKFFSRIVWPQERICWITTWTAKNRGKLTLEFVPCLAHVPFWGWTFLGSNYRCSLVTSEIGCCPSSPTCHKSGRKFLWSGSNTTGPLST